MTLKLNQLKAFVEVAQQGSIRAASRELAISQPAVTKAIKELEESLEASLLHRHSQGIILTECGETLLTHATLILKEMMIAEESVRQCLGDTSGHVNIGIGVSIACELLPEVISRFRSRYPLVKLRIQEGQFETHIEHLRSGRLDFAINTVHSDMIDTEFSMEKIWKIPFKLVARKNHPQRSVRKLEELAGCDWVLPTAKNSYILNVLEILAEHGASVKQAVTCESYLSTLSIISKTDCIGIVSEAALNHYTFADQLTEIQIDYPMPAAVYYLICRKSSPLTPAAAALAKAFLYQARPIHRW
jgi:LysR family transcriptional regulator of abg operon